MSSPNTKKILIGLAVLVLGGLGYYFFFSSSSTVPVGLLVPSDGQVVGQDVLVLVEKLRTISIDQNVFSEALFTSLQDRTVSLTPESQGRQNPFALIGLDAPVQIITALPVVVAPPVKTVPPVKTTGKKSTVSSKTSGQ